MVLQSPRVLEDREKPEDGAPPLHTRIESEKIPPGKYHVEIGGVGRPLAISLDGENWKKIEGSGRNLGILEIGQEGFQLWVDDRYASGTNPGSATTIIWSSLRCPIRSESPRCRGLPATRVEEKLGRGLVAMPCDGGRIYVGWRLLKGDPRTWPSTFTGASQGPPVKLNESPLTQTTDFVDAAPSPDVKKRVLRRGGSGRQSGPARRVCRPCRPSEGDHLTIKLNGDHTFQKCGIADLNADGEYDYVIKQPNANIDPYQNYWEPSPGPTRSKPTWRTARSCGVTIWDGPSSGESGTRRWWSTISTAMAEPKCA